MSDAAITTLASSLVQIVLTVVGFLTLWVKLRYGVEVSQKAANKAQDVESKLDANTVTTESVNAKADTIVKQTNGSFDQVRILVAKIAERVDKLEEYNRTNAHRIFDAINAVHLKVAELSVSHKGQPDRSKPESSGT